MPTAWRGALPGMWYRIGGVLPNNLTVQAHITTNYKKRKTYNTIGYITGAVEPGISLSKGL